RESFEKESLKELADSIRDAKIIQPIVVRQYGYIYQIIAGERRWRAAQMAGLKEISCIVKEVAEERVLLESLIENLHRKNLTDTERENAIHEIWHNRNDFGIKTKAELAKRLGIREQKVLDDIEAWEFRHKEEIPMGTSTDVIRRTRGLESEMRRRIVEKVEIGEIKASEVDTVAKVIRRAPEPLRKEVLKPKSRITPKIAETIMTKLPSEEEQKVVIDEIKRSRLTEDEVEDRVREIQRAKEMGRPLTKEMGVKEGIIYTIGEYECPQCKKHYLIKCNGKRDWIE
ncbi:MAG: ParB/RepB/Spo0J family partition protein, partial [Candidatus Methanofastidiosia archaeon]